MSVKYLRYENSVDLVEKATHMTLYQMSSYILSLSQQYSGIVDESNYLAISDDQT